MKLKQLEMRLQSLETPQRPRADLEQYQTPAPLAARLVFIAYGNGDIGGRRVLDMGCGNGCLAIAAALLGAWSAEGFDADGAMTALAEENSDSALRLPHPASTISSPSPPSSREVSMPPAPVFTTETVEEFRIRARREGLRWDTAVMNPPFGSQRKGADRPFLAGALELADAVYSIHRKGTEDFVRRMAGDAGFDIPWEEAAPFAIPRTFDFHDREREHIGVSLFNMVRRGSQRP